MKLNFSKFTPFTTSLAKCAPHLGRFSNRLASAAILDQHLSVS